MLLKKLLPVEKGFIPYLISLALPIVIESALYVAVDVTDIIMIGRYSAEVGIAAISLAGTIFFGGIMLIFGFSSAAGVFLSRAWGAKNYTELRATFGLTVAVVLILSLLAAVAVYIYAVPIITLMAGEEGELQVITYAVQYLRIAALSLPFIAFSIMVSGFFRSVEKSHYPMWIAAACIPINIFLNWVFIFGNLGLPAMGVAGAAIAYLAVRVLDAILNLLLLLSRKNPISGFNSEYFKFLAERNVAMVGRYLKVALPLAASDMVWVLALIAYRAAFARAGTEVVAAFAAISSLMQIFFVAFFGVGTACSIILGKTIGENDIRKVKHLSKVFIRLNFIMGIPLGLIMLATVPFMPAIFSLSGNAAAYMVHAAIITGILFGFRSFEYMMAVGILRAGGDVKWLLIIQALTMWLLGVPVLFLMVFLGMPPFVLYLIVVGEEIVRCFFYMLRYRTGRWIKQV
ncbi:MAG: MATE family efflux transporter [Spirochaetaceae bacterium]|nr:MATE family efflux transporter [Spirochaetaceae bacterium]